MEQEKSSLLEKIKNLSRKRKIAGIFIITVLVVAIITISIVCSTYKKSKENIDDIANTDNDIINNIFNK